MSYNTRLLRMQKCKSLTDIGDEEEFQTSRKHSGGQKVKKRTYTGRRSLGITASKLRYRKGKTGRDRDYDYGGNDEEVDEGYKSAQCTYKCIPPLEKTIGREFSQSSDLDSGVHMLTSVSKELEEPVVIVPSDRKTLHVDIAQFMKTYERSKDQVVMEKCKYWCRTYGDYTRFTCRGKDKKKYKFENILWLVLRSYFSGGNCNDEDMWQQEDARISKERLEKEKILRKIELYKFLEESYLNEPFVAGPRSTMQPAPISDRRLLVCPTYVKALGKAKREVDQLLNDFDEYSELFLHSKACWEGVEAGVLARLEITEPQANKADLKQQAKREAEFLERKIIVMRGWSNTLNDLVEKVATIGKLLSDGDQNFVWLHPLDESNEVKCLHDVKHVFENYVKQSINLKGMKKVLERVDSTMKVTLIKASIFLQRPAQSYAQTVTSKHVIKLSDKWKERYGDMLTSKLGAESSTVLNLPFLGPIFFFLLGIPMQLVIQWLNFRMEVDAAESDVSMDDLSYEALIEDSRDCVQEAVRIKKNYVNTLQSMCPICALPESLFPIDFNNCVLGVFNKYIHYLRCWANCEAVMQPDPTKLFMKLEKEWPVALECSRFIASAPDNLFSFICDITGMELEKLIDDYADEQVEVIKKKAFAETEFINRVFFGVEPDEKTLKIMRTKFYSPVYLMIRRIQERETRIFSILRTAIADVHDCVGYEMAEEKSVNQLVDALKHDHCLIELKVPSSDGSTMVNLPVAMLVDVQTANHADVDLCLLWVYERRRLETCPVTSAADSNKELGKNCHMVVIPDPKGKITRDWQARRECVEIDEEKRIYFSYFRSDQILVLGNWKLEDKYGHFVKLVSPSASSNEVIHTRLLYLVEDDLFRHLYRYYLKIDLLRRKLDETKGVLRDGMIGCLQQQFSINMQIHREVMRIVSDSYMVEFGRKMVEENIHILIGYKNFLISFANIRREYRPSLSLPVWATPAITFMHACSEPKWTNPEVMTDAQYKILVDIVNECKQLLVIPEHSKHLLEANHEKPKHRYRITTSTTSSGGSKLDSIDAERPLTRAERLQKSAAQFEDKVQHKMEGLFKLGKVVDRVDGRAQLGMSPSQMVLREKKAPFEWHAMEEIGSGSYGTVYRAHLVKLGRVVAAKKVKVTDGAAKKAEQISNEIDILMKLNHDNLVKYYGVEVTKTEVIIFMEYCSEGSLERICAGGMDLKIARRYTNHLLKAVEYIHKCHIVHRDIKPENIFLDRKYALKLGDFGCSKQLSGNSTIMGELVDFAGTPQYMAPELFSQGGSSTDGKYRGHGRSVDIWSVGCVVIHMLTGKNPWPGMNYFQISWALCEKRQKPDYPPISTERKDLRNFLDATFVYNPVNREPAGNLLQFTFANVSLVDDSSPQTTV